METSMTIGAFLEFYRKTMQQKQTDPGMYSPLALAYMGDAVYEVMIRLRVMNQGSMQVNKMHRRSTELVKAGAQAELMHAIEGELTPQEHAVYKRGRNAKSVTMAKHATMTDYRTATGFEALVGWLFLMEEYERLTVLIGKGLKALGVLNESEEETPDGTYTVKDGEQI